MIPKAIVSMIDYFGADVHQINHSLKVLSFAYTISGIEINEPHLIERIQLASIFHDIGIPEAKKKYASSAGKYQEIEGPPIARKILSGMNVDPQEIERICYLIGNHHSYSKIDGIDFQILVEADFLVNIYEEEMNNEMTAAINEKYFKTKTGIDILNRMYLY
jgi:HD superfamily phosphodiesterase